MLVSLMMASAWCVANNLGKADGYITVKENGTVEAPRGSSIHASIDGHLLMVTFTENLGQVVSLRNKTNNNNSYFCCA